MPAKRMSPTPPMAIPIIAWVLSTELFVAGVVEVLEEPEGDVVVAPAGEEAVAETVLPLDEVVRLDPFALALALAPVLGVVTGEEVVAEGVEVEGEMA